MDRLAVGLAIVVVVVALVVALQSIDAEPVCIYTYIHLLEDVVDLPAWKQRRLLPFDLTRPPEAPP